MAGKYDNLWLVMKAPVTAYYEHHQTWTTTDIRYDNCNLNKQACESLHRPNRWVMHGLWPCRIKGNSPTYCVHFAPKYNDSLVESDLRTILEQNWMSFMDSNPVEGLWEHEWDKHGTCATDRPFMNTQVKFFKNVVELLNLHNIGRILKEHNIIAGNSYPLNRIVTTINDHFQAETYIKCIESQNSEKQEQYLAEVGICFSKEMKNVNCKRSGLDGPQCDYLRNVTYPTLLKEKPVKF